MNFRYEGLTRFFKGNTHVHTTGSDGMWTPDEAIARYRDAGYDFLAVTDHNVVTRLQDRSTDSFCLIDSVEIDRTGKANWRTEHVVCVGVGPKFPDGASFSRMLSAARRAGAVICLAHPHWSGNSYQQVARGPFDGVELFNGVTYYHNRRENGIYLWDEVLRTGRDMLGFAADDNHGRPTGVKVCDLGWVMVGAERLGRESILSALRAGKFYSSTGPQFRSIELAGDKLTVHCSPVEHVWLLGPAWINKRINCAPGQVVEGHEFDLAALREKEGELPFLRLEIQDAQGGRAWTNKLFV
jgi:hypothetical protein